MALLLGASADWYQRSKLIGIAQCRRTYCRHIVLEFLAVHPAIVGKQDDISGIGTGLICGLAEIAQLIGSPLIWGEATEDSARFYREILKRRGIRDSFFMRKAELDYARERFQTKLDGSGTLA